MTNKQEKIYHLSDIAKEAMIERDLLPGFTPAVLEELASINSPGEPKPNYKMHDMRDKLWVSIDNDDSLDLDQLTYAETAAEGLNKIYVAVADVDALVPLGSAIDRQAAYNTTSVYTPTKVFSMLPPKLSTDLTSLNESEDRCAVVVEMTVDSDGQFEMVDVYLAWVHNHVKLAYNRVAAWLEGKVAYPSSKAETGGLTEQLKLQDRIAQRIKLYRDSKGSLNFKMVELRAVVKGDKPVALEDVVHNRAHEIIENFMIAANVAVTHYLLDKNLPVLKRVVRSPQRWDRIVEVANKLGEKLPEEVDVIALQQFLLKQQKVNPDGFPDLSLAIIKLIGRGEYVVGDEKTDTLIHFDLAIEDYSHTTAPNRRYPDLIMQRLLKSCFYDEKTPYTDAELHSIARRCTAKEVDASKVERRLRKSAVAMVLKEKIGQIFPAIVTGASSKGTWVRLKDPQIEGKVIEGAEGLDVGDYTRVKLIKVDIPNGFIDFKRVKE